MRLVMLGPPGAGKGTQAVRLAAHFRCGHVSTGDIFREHVANETPLGRTAQEYLDAGAEALDEWLESAGTPLDAALFFEIDEEELFRRLAGRSAALHRSDDREQTIRHRLEVFAAKTRPLVDHYEQRDLLQRVDSIGEVDEVTKRILDGLERRRAPQGVWGAGERGPATAPGGEAKPSVSPR